MDNSTQGETMKFYDVPIKVNTDPSLNASDLLLERVAINPSHPIFSRQNTDGTWRNVTSQEFLDEVRSLAKGLIAQGIKPGDAVAIMSRTRYEWNDRFCYLVRGRSWCANLRKLFGKPNRVDTYRLGCQCAIY